MEKERAEDLRELLVHPDETAGGLMTTALSQSQGSGGDGGDRPHAFEIRIFPTSTSLIMSIL